MALGFGGRARIHAMAFALIVPSACEYGANNHHRNQQDDHPPSIQHSHDLLHPPSDAARSPDRRNQAKGRIAQIRPWASD
jgi:hypothetical protein